MSETVNSTPGLVDIELSDGATGEEPESDWETGKSFSKSIFLFLELLSGNKEKKKMKPKGQQPGLKRVKVVDDANTPSKPTKIMRRPKNNASWARIRAGLEQIIVKERDRRLEFERERRRELRLHTFKNLLDAHCLTVLPAIWLQYPYWREIATFPEFSQIIDSADNVTVNEESLAPAMVKLPSLIEKWLKDKRAALKQELMASNADNSLTTFHSSMTDDLDLATAIFKCAGEGCVQNTPLYAEVSSNPLFGWADAASHICSSYINNLWTIFSNPTYPKTVISPFKDASAVAARLVRLVGLDPSCATIVDMDRGGYYFFCSGCPKSQTRQKAYPWRAAVCILSRLHLSI
ncbi:hypothetical protein C0992_008684 [Termitomyces sp. T32_za158]|nr:hypothetical protein C0992_008684 [Termitomyces sp. T32_za158]